MRKISALGGAADLRAKAVRGEDLSLEVHVLGNDTRVPRPARRRHPAGHEIREDGRKIERQKAEAKAHAIAARGLAEIAGDRHRAGDDVEEDVPLRAEE